MTYMRELRALLMEQLGELEDVWRESDVAECDKAREAFIRFVCEKILESYRNGQQTPAPVEKKEGKAPSFVRNTAQKNTRR